MTELKPCPFCGGKGRVDGEGIYWEVWCEQCGARASDGDTPTEAAELWNTRASLSTPEAGGVAEMTLAQADGHSAVRVKPLQWKEDSPNEYTAETPSGGYTVYGDPDEEMEAFPWVCAGPDEMMGHFTSADEAKAEATTHHETSIRACLETAYPVSAPVGVKVKELAPAAWERAVEAAEREFLSGDERRDGRRAFDAAIEAAVNELALTSTPKGVEELQAENDALRQYFNDVTGWLSKRGLYDHRDYEMEGPDLAQILSDHEEELLRPPLDLSTLTPQVRAVVEECRRQNGASTPKGVDAVEARESDPALLARLRDDGAAWAAEFRKTAIRLGYSAMDERWLIGWFCNAIENTEATRRERWQQEIRAALKAAGIPDTSKEGE